MHTNRTVARFVDKELRILRAIKQCQSGMITETELTLYIVDIIAHESDAYNRRQLAQYLKPISLA